MLSVFFFFVSLFVFFSSVFFAASLTHTGMIVFALATLSCTLPHFLFGDDLMHSTNSFYGGASMNDAISTSLNSPNSSFTSLCHPASANGSLSNGK